MTLNIYLQPDKEATNCSNIRDYIDAVTPPFLRFAMTEVTGKAATGETALWIKNSFQSVFVAFSALFGGVFLSILAVTNRNTCIAIVLLLLGYFTTTSGARMLQVGVSHSCAHINCFKNYRIDFILGEMISILILIRSFVTYAPDHLAHHDLKKH